MLYAVSLQFLFQNNGAHAVQLFIRIIVDDELPSLGCRFHLHLGAKMFSQLVFKVMKFVGHRLQVFAGTTTFLPSHKLFRLSHRQLF